MIVIFLPPIITSTDCKLRGSDVIERIRLNEAFRFFVRTRITWVDGSERRLATDTQIRVQVEPPRPRADGSPALASAEPLVKPQPALVGRTYENRAADSRPNH